MKCVTLYVAYMTICSSNNILYKNIQLKKQLRFNYTVIMFYMLHLYDYYNPKI